MQKKKILKIILVVVLIVVILGLAAGLTLYFTVFNPKKRGAKMRADINAERPQYESVLAKSRDDFSSEKDFALYLYERACYAFQNSEECVIVEDYVTTTTVKIATERMEMACQGCRFTLKKGTEYYYADYSGADAYAAELMKAFGAAEDSLFAKRSYTDLSVMDHLYTEKVLRPSVEVTEEGNFEIEANWNDLLDGYPKNEELPVFHSSQEDVYRQTEMNIEADTVSGATVTYNEELGYYTVSFILDVNNPKTSEKLIDNLRSGLKNGNYTSITKVYQIWDNGYFKKCESLDYAAASIIELKLDFRSYFKYAEKDCDPSLYQYFDEAKQKALADNNK